MLNIFHCVLNLRVARVSVVVPSCEDGLVTSIILLTVMGRTNLDLGLQVILLGKGTRGDHGDRIVRGRLLEVGLFFLFQQADGEKIRPIDNNLR